MQIRIKEISIGNRNISKFKVVRAFKFRTKNTQYDLLSAYERNVACTQQWSLSNSYVSAMTVKTTFVLILSIV